MKNKKVMSIAIMPELQQQLKVHSKRRGISASSYVGNLVEQAVKINPDDDPMIIGKPIDEDVIPVVLKIPASLKQDPESLRKWMTVQTEGIVKAMEKKKNPESSGDEVS